MQIQFDNLIQSLQQQWACPITQQPMSDPVITCDGHTYERKAIILWFNKQQTSPKTNLPLPNKQLIPNIIMRNVIKKFTQDNHIFLRRIKNIIDYEQTLKISGLKRQYKNELQQKNIKIEELQRKNYRLNQFINQLLKNKLKNQIEKNFINPQEVINTSFSLKIFKKLNKNLMNLIFSKYIQDKYPQFLKYTNKNQSQMFSTSNSFYDESYQMKSSKQITYRKLYKLSKQFKSIKNIYYLSKIFNNSNKLIQERYYKIKNNSNLYGLNHERININMQQFVKYDWTNLIFLDLKNTNIGNLQWKIFVQNSDRFPNLQTIEIYNNKISNINVQDFEQFKKLKQIWFYHNYGGTNPLSNKSRENLALAKKMNKKLEINY